MSGGHKSSVRGGPAWLYALGRKPTPHELRIEGRRYAYVRLLKHDFFAATALYACAEEGAGEEERVVVKIGRRAPIAGLPMRWLGRALARREMRYYHKFANQSGVPRSLGMVNQTSFAHPYVEGKSLAEQETVDEEFFPALSTLLRELHTRNMAYVDLDKPQNVLVGADGKPHLIDFQISWSCPSNRRWLWWWRWEILRLLQRSDEYHLTKQIHKYRPQDLTPAQRARGWRVPIWIRAHRLIARPIIHTRRRVLMRLGARETGADAHETGRKD